MAVQGLVYTVRGGSSQQGEESTQREPKREEEDERQSIDVSRVIDHSKDCLVCLSQIALQARLIRYVCLSTIALDLVNAAVFVHLLKTCTLAFFRSGARLAPLSVLLLQRSISLRRLVLAHPLRETFPLSCIAGRALGVA